MSRRDIATIDIRLLIPQRGPIITIDHLLRADAAGAVSSFRVTGEHLFSSKGFFSELGMIENAAQTAAARFGMLFFERSETVPIGFIGAVTKAEVLSLPPVDSLLITQVEVIKEILDASLLSAVVRVDNSVVFRCEIKLFILRGQ